MRAAHFQRVEGSHLAQPNRSAKRGVILQHNPTGEGQSQPVDTRRELRRLIDAVRSCVDAASVQDPDFLVKALTELVDHSHALRTALLLRMGAANAGKRN